MKTLRMTAAILFSVLILGACDNSDEIKKNGDDLNITVTIKYLNSQGENLFDTATANHYLKDSVALFYVMDGQIITSDKIDVLGANEAYNTQDSVDNPYVYINPMIPEKSGVTTSFIKLTEDDMDTLETYISVQLGLIQTDTVWYNGRSIPNENGIFQVIK